MAKIDKFRKRIQKNHEMIVTESKRVDGSRRVKMTTQGPSLTRQEFTEECDINVILRRHRSPEALAAQVRGNPIYGDFTNLPSYQEAMNITALADQQWSQLPSEVRDRFGTIERYLEFTSDPKNNLEEGIKYGFWKKKPEPEPEKIQKVEVVNNDNSK